MYCTLSELHDSINQMIEQQGKDAPCSAFVFTKNDVSYYETGEDGFPVFNEEKFLNNADTEDVLIQLGKCDYIYEQVNEIIADEISRIRNKVVN